MTRENENNINSTSSLILKHDTNDSIIKLEEFIFKIQRITGNEFILNL